MDPDARLRLYQPGIDAPPPDFRGRPRWLYGDTHPVIAMVAEDVRVEIGDLVWQPPDACEVWPAREVALAMEVGYDRVELQRRFAQGFLGVAMQRCPIGERHGIRVATTGVFVFDCAPDRYRIGSLLGAEWSPDGTVLRDQAVRIVQEADRAIGRVAKTEREPRATVQVWICSRVMAPIV